MNLEEIREAARERDYEAEPEPLVVDGSPVSVKFDLRGLAEEMAPKLEALAKAFGVAALQLADILDKAWGEITAASETAPAAGLRGEGAGLLLSGMTKVIDGQDEVDWDDSVDVFARAREVIGSTAGMVAGMAGGFSGIASEAADMEKKLAEVAAVTGSTVESIRDSVRALARSTPKSMAACLADVSLDFGRVRDKHGDLVAKMYVQERLVAVSTKLETTHSITGAVRFEARFAAATHEQSLAVQRAVRLAGTLPMIQIEDGMATPFAKWPMDEKDASNYYSSADRGKYLVLSFDVGSFE